MTEEVRSEEILPELRAAIGLVLTMLAPEIQTAKRDYALDTIIDATVNALSGYRVLFPSGSRMTPAKIQAIRDAWSAGFDCPAICSKLGVSRATAYRYRQPRA